MDEGLIQDWDDVQDVIDPPNLDDSDLRTRMRDTPASELASRTGLSVRQLKRIRKGKSRPSADARGRIERALSVPNAFDPGPLRGSF